MCVSGECMVDICHIDVWRVVEFPVTLCCPIAGFVLWLYLHCRIDGYVINIESVLRCVDAVSEVGIVLSIILFLWVLWIRVPVVR